MVTLLAALAIERAFELWLSRRNAARLRKKGALEFGASHTRVMALFHGAVLLACAMEGRAGRFEPPPWLARGAIAALLLAQGLRYWAVATLGERWNIRVLVLPDAAPVAAGPYRFVRHPNYLAVIIEMVALPLACGAPATAFFATLGNAALLRGRIAIEEHALGRPYALALADRPRLLPTRRRHVGNRDPIGDRAYRP